MLKNLVEAQLRLLDGFVIVVVNQNEAIEVMFFTRLEFLPHFIKPHLVLDLANATNLLVDVVDRLLHLVIVCLVQATVDTLVAAGTATARLQLKAEFDDECKDVDKEGADLSVKPGAQSTER